MSQSHPTNGVASFKLPKERLAQLDRLAKKRGVTRSWIVRQAVENLLERSEETMTPKEVAELRRRQYQTQALLRLGEINRKHKAFRNGKLFSGA